jgi:hypothetical protein
MTYHTPRHPEGTPEYEAYAAKLRAELTKWVAGEGEYARTPPGEVSADTLRAELDEWSNVSISQPIAPGKWHWIAYDTEEWSRFDAADVWNAGPADTEDPR